MIQSMVGAESRAQLDQSVATMLQNYEVCPTHSEYFITNFCVCEECKEPLCAECIAIHTELHSQNNSRSKIQNIQRVRQECQQLLYRQQQQIQRDIDLVSQQRAGGAVPSVADLAEVERAFLEQVQQHFAALRLQVEQAGAQQQQAERERGATLQLLLLKQQELAHVVAEIEGRNYVKPIIDVFENVIDVESHRQRCEDLLQLLQSAQPLRLQFSAQALAQTPQFLASVVALGRAAEQSASPLKSEPRPQAPSFQSPLPASQQIDLIQYSQKQELRESLFRSQVSRGSSLSQSRVGGAQKPGDARTPNGPAQDPATALNPHTPQKVSDFSVAHPPDEQNRGFTRNISGKAPATKHHSSALRPSGARDPRASSQDLSRSSKRSKIFDEPHQYRTNFDLPSSSGRPSKSDSSPYEIGINLNEAVIGLDYYSSKLLILGQQSDNGPVLQTAVHLADSVPINPQVLTVDNKILLIGTHDSRFCRELEIV